MNPSVDRAIFFAFGFFMGVVFSFFVNMVSTAHAHDWKRPDLDAWYEGLHRPHMPMYSGGTSCCSREDCHTTEAEIRNGHWWARLARPNDRNGKREWEPDAWKEVPDESVLHERNEAGEAVVCHPTVWLGQHLNPDATIIYCFVPPDQI